MTRRIIWNDDLDNALKQLYANPRLSRYEIEDQIGINHVSLWRRAKELGISRRNWRRIPPENRA